MTADGCCPQHLTEGVQLGNDENVKASVSKYYGETLKTSDDLKTSACCTAKAPPKEVLDVLKKLPQEIVSKYYGCGSPFPRGIKDSGLRVLDLGCGSGRDCYVCAALVGEKGFVTGVDMTPSQLAVAEKHAAAWQQQLGYPQPNMKFVQGAIEQLDATGIAPNSIDLVISNCVINLSPDKAAVLQQVHRALADGGEMYFSDVYCDRRLPAELRQHEVLLGECLGGALAVDDFVQLAQQVGFQDPRVLEVEPITVHDPELRELLGDAAFYSITFRLFKLPNSLLTASSAAASAPSKVVTYKGSLAGAADSYELDYQHTFQTGVPVLVSANTAAMCGSSWLKAHFSVHQPGGCCCPKPEQTISSTPVSMSSIAALVASSSSKSSCCAPAAAPAAAIASSCCGTAAAPAAAAASNGGCCAAPAAAVSAADGCCPTNSSKGVSAEPAAAATAANGGCCAQPAAAAPKAGVADGAAASSNGCGSDKCC